MISRKYGYWIMVGALVLVLYGSTVLVGHLICIFLCMNIINNINNYNYPLYYIQKLCILYNIDIRKLCWIHKNWCTSIMNIISKIRHLCDTFDSSLFRCFLSCFLSSCANLLVDIAVYSSPLQLESFVNICTSSHNVTMVCSSNLLNCLQVPTW